MEISDEGHQALKNIEIQLTDKNSAGNSDDQSVDSAPTSFVAKGNTVDTNIGAVGKVKMARLPPQICMK